MALCARVGAFGPGRVGVVTCRTGVRATRDRARGGGRGGEARLEARVEHRRRTFLVSSKTASTMNNTATIDTVVALCKRRGFVFPCGEIYGGTRSAWDYGPLGVELKENIKRQWWKSMVTGREDVVGLDSSVILPRQVWVASGHVGVFTDPLVECTSCHKRFRADQLVEEYNERTGKEVAEDDLS